MSLESKQHFWFWYVSFLLKKALVASEDYSGSTSSNSRSADFLELSHTVVVGRFIR